MNNNQPNCGYAPCTCADCAGESCDCAPDSYIIVDLGGGITMTMNLIAPGTFTMGQDSIAMPAHEVRGGARGNFEASTELGRAYQEYRYAIKSGDMDRMRDANFALADVESEVARLRDDAHSARGQIPRELRGLFTSEEGAYRTKVANILHNAADYRKSENLGLTQDALELFRGLSNRERQTLNDSNNVNILANANGIEQMLALLRELITATREGREINLTILDD